ncbi:MFS transporter [Ramlibacter albus]|uniref:MFS transporter n=1 Tax=Ramlibacter albus TaxID=2079448 RepID=A0A923S0C6_9BURK|nr:MFS transporter [Ramlibacter albus]MBC5763204.1 MFS transporter [Ramlibacter albus]
MSAIAPHHTFIYERGGAMHLYMAAYALAALAGAALWGGVGNVLIPLHVQQLDEAAKAGNLALIKSVAVAVTMVMQPLVGVASDRTRSRWGRRAPWLVAGALATAAGLAGMQFATAVWQLLTGWVAAQVGITMVMGPLAATVADRMPAAQRGIMSAVAGAGLLLGFTLGIALASALYARFGLGSYLVFASGVMVFSALFVAVARDRSSLGMQQGAAGMLAHVLSCTHALRDWDFRFVWLARILMMCGYATAATYTVYMLQSYIEPGQTAAQAATTVSLLHLAAVPGTLLAMVVAGRWSDRVMRRKPFVIGASFLLAASMAVPLAWPALPALYIQFVVGGVAFGTFLAVDQALLIDVLPNKDAAGRDLGMGQFAANLGSLLGPVLAGAVLAGTGGYRLVWLAALLALVVSALALMPVKHAR